jgi:hypothetical protein
VTGCDTRSGNASRTQIPGHEQAATIFKCSSYVRYQQRFKRSFTPDLPRPFSRQLSYAFNSLPLIQVVENICGIRAAQRVIAGSAASPAPCDVWRWCCRWWRISRASPVSPKAPVHSDTR